MAFRKLENCDSSDMRMWALTHACINFEKEVVTQRDMAMRALVKCKASEHDEYAAKVRAYDYVLGLLEEARTLK